MIPYKDITITERDWKLIRFLGEYRVIAVDDVGKIYGTERYHELRLTVLKKAKLINRKNSYVYLTQASRNLLKQQNLPCNELNSLKQSASRYPRIARLSLDMEGSEWDFIPSWRYKGNTMGDRTARFYGIITNSQKTYAVYNIGKKPQEKSLMHLKNEMETLPMRFDITRAVIFAETASAMKAYGEESLGLMEQLLLPYNDRSLQLLKAAAKENLIKKAAQMTYKHGGPPEWRGADYTVDDGKQVAVLILHDIEKISRLNDYAELIQYRRLKKRNNIEILCLTEQEKYYKDKYPYFQIKTIDLDRLLAVEKS